MTDLLIRGIDPKLKERLKKSARAHNRSLSKEAQSLLDDALGKREPWRKMGVGTWMQSLLPEEFRGDDLVFEVEDLVRKPPDFK
jgi:plasmid stability protein